MKDKKILFIFSFITIILIFSLTLNGKDIEKLTNIFSTDKEVGNEKSEKENKDTIEEKKENGETDENIYIERNGTSIYLKSNLDSINPITSLSWINNHIFRFNFTIEEEKVNNIIYDYNTKTQKIEPKFKISGIIWEWDKVNRDAIVYSNDDFNRLFYMNNKGKEIKISENQEWYNISPDGKKIIVDGIPENNKNKSKRFIYDLEQKEYKSANYIPHIDYVYSYIAATWSPDSTHIVSQKPGNDNLINIIDINKGIEKSINIDDSVLTLPTWSENGKKLAFLIQSKKYKDYIIGDLEMDYFLSDKIGIYDTKTKKINIINLDNKLTTSSINWSKDSKKIIIETAGVGSIERLLKRDLTQINTKIETINIKEGEIKEILESGLDMSDDYPVHKVTPIKVFSNNLFLFTDSDNDVKDINIMPLDKKGILTKNIGYLYSHSEYKDNIYLISDEGVYLISDDLKVKELINFKKEYGRDTLNVDAKISPDYKKIVLYVQYDIDSKNKTFIEIKDLK